MYSILLVLSTLSFSLSQLSFNDNAPFTDDSTGRVGGIVALKCGFNNVDWFKLVDDDYVNLKDLR